MIGLKCLRLQFKGHWFPSWFSTRIVGEGISPLSVAYAGFCKCCTLVFKNIVFPQPSKEIWNSVNSFVKVPCLGNAKWIWSIESKSKGKSSMGSTWSRGFLRLQYHSNCWRSIKWRCLLYIVRLMYYIAYNLLLKNIMSIRIFILSYGNKVLWNTTAHVHLACVH